MGRRRRNRQPDASMLEINKESLDSEDNTNIADDGCRTRVKICPHVDDELQRINFSSLKKINLDTECTVCEKLDGNRVPAEDEEFSPPPLWLCLRCFHQACGREQKSHALEHYRSKPKGVHCLVANTQSWGVWCYCCDDDITNHRSHKLHKVLEIVKKLQKLSKKLPDSISNDPSSPDFRQLVPSPSVRSDVANVNANKSKLPDNNLTRVVGLMNLGNTCFFNAVLQCLSQTPYLIKVLEDLEVAGKKFVLPGGKCKIADDSEEMELSPIEGSLENCGSFTSILCKTLKKMQSMQTHQNFPPSELLSSFRKKTMECTDGGQHDSHELLRHLLEIVRNEDLQRYQSIILKQLGIEAYAKPNSINNVQKAHAKFYRRQASSRLLGAEIVFRGVLVSTLTCLECDHSSQRTEPFLDLSLPVTVEKPQSPIVNSCFRRKQKNVDDTLESASSNASSPPSIKNQFLKTEEKQEQESKKQRKQRMREKGNNRNSPKSNYNRISEEKQSGVVEFENDANIEGNGSGPDIVESGYSSEKVSTLTSPVSPDDHDPLKSSIEQFNINTTAAINGNSSPVDGNADVDVEQHSSADSTKITSDEDGSSHKLNGQRPTELSMNFDETIQKTSNLNWESPAIETINEIKGIKEYNRISSFASLFENSEASPEEAMTSPPSSPSTSTDSSTSSLSNVHEEKPESENDFNRDTSEKTCCLEQIRDELRSIEENSSKKSVEADGETVKEPRESEPIASAIRRWGSQLVCDDQNQQPEIKSEAAPPETEWTFYDGLDGLGSSTENLLKKSTEADIEEERKKRKAANRENEQIPNSILKLLTKNESENGVTDITQGMSKLEVSPNGRTNCYRIKDGDCSIQACLNQFTALELISGSNKVCCEACTARENKDKEGSTKMVCTPSTKQYLISEVPAILILHLKRFQGLRSGFRKLPTHVSFPMLLDLSPICKKPGKPKIYSLYGTIEHSGTLHGGHYVAYVKTRAPLTPDDPRWEFLSSRNSEECVENSGSSGHDSETDEAFTECNVEPPPGHWYYVSDARVMEVDEATVLRSQAYMLFYERIL